MNQMKIDTAVLAALVVIGTNLLARMAVQGVEPALLAAVIEHGREGMRTLKTLLPNTVRFDW